MLNALQGGGQLNRLKALWREGQCTFGVIATIPSVETVQIMARAGPVSYTHLTLPTNREV